MPTFSTFLPGALLIAALVFFVFSQYLSPLALPRRARAAPLVCLLGSLAACAVSVLWQWADARTAQLADEEREGGGAANAAWSSIDPITLKRRTSSDTTSGAADTPPGRPGRSGAWPGALVALLSVRQGATLVSCVGGACFTVSAWVLFQMAGNMDAAVLLLVLVPVLWLAAVLAVAEAVPSHVTPFVNPKHTTRSLAALRHTIYAWGVRLFPAVHAVRAIGTKLVYPKHAFTADVAFMLQDPATGVASFVAVSAMVACISVHCGLSRAELCAQLGILGFVVFPQVSATASPAASWKGGGILDSIPRITVGVALAHVAMAALFWGWQNRIDEEEAWRVGAMSRSVAITRQVEAQMGARGGVAAGGAAGGADRVTLREEKFGSIVDEDEEGSEEGSAVYEGSSRWEGDEEEEQGQSYE